ncbi:MAG: PAS domain-containing sensor histidine kinase [Janthinobacterium lividum]
MSLPPAQNLSLEAQNVALRAEIHQLRAAQTVAQAQQTQSADQEQRQIRFHTIFENSPFGQKIITPDLIIRQANETLVQMLGCAQLEDVVGHQIMEFAHPDHRADWRFLQDRLWHHQLPSFTLETCLLHTDGSSIWCQVTSIRFSDGDQVLGYTQLEDISLRKALELRLKRLYDAQETIQHLVTHDLRTPIGHIQMLTNLLEGQVDTAQLTADQAPDAAQYFALIRQACATAMKLLKDVLLLGALDATSLQLRPSDLSALLTQRLPAHRLAAHEKGLTLDLDLPPQVVQANLDPDAFGRVVDNLVSNALKFTPAGGRVSVGLREQAGRVRLTVQDTGMGIPKALLAGLFEKFSPSARAGVGGEASTGLGLFITRQIVQQHRGKIWVESQPGVGTCFFVEL